MAEPTNEVYLLFGGKTGWLGGMLNTLLTEQGKTVVLAETRIENRESLIEEIERVNPTHVLNAAGLTGRPNVDWCESNKEATIRVNVCGTLNLADVCSERGIHCTMYATGCIFEYDDAHPLGGGLETAFGESGEGSDAPNFHGSFYSHTKAMVEDLLRNYSNICVLRVRMPISDDLSPRNFVTKISKYEKVVNIPNSMTILHDLLPVSLAMAAARKCGVYNFCNPGAISHNQVLDAYKEYIDPEFTYTNFTVEEQAKVIVAARSNNELNCTKLVETARELGLDIPDIHTGIVNCMLRMRENLRAEGIYPDNLPRRPSAK